MSHHIGWQTAQMVDHYIQMGKVLGWSIVSSSASPSAGFNDQNLVQRLSSEFREKNSVAENLMRRIVK